MSVIEFNSVSGGAAAGAKAVGMEVGIEVVDLDSDADFWAMGGGGLGMGRRRRWRWLRRRLLRLSPCARWEGSRKIRAGWFMAEEKEAVVGW